MSTQIDPVHLKTLMDRHIVRIVDASWALDGSDMKAAWQSEHLPGAVFFDLETVRDSSSVLPHMAAPPEVFAQAVGQMGISAEDYVVVYDRFGLFSAARIWWNFKLMGHDRVTVLQGGLLAWKGAGFDVESGPVAVVPVTYVPAPRPDRVISREALADKLKSGSTIILDARPTPRFEGLAAEPRPGLLAGHMPGAINLPFGALIRDGALISRVELEDRFRVLGIAPDADIVTTCGSGVTAAILSLALYETGRKTARLYDGSWAEWGQPSLGLPVVVGLDA